MVGYSREHVLVKGYIILKTTFGEQDQTKEIKTMYLVIDTSSSYNIIIRRPTFNQLGTALYNLYLCMKYPLPNGRVRVIQGDQEIARKYYVESLKLKKVHTMDIKSRKVSSGINPSGGTYKGVKALPPTSEEIED